MTKLEQQIEEAIKKARYEYGQACGGTEDDFIAKAVAKIARDLAYDAYEQGASDSADYYQGYGRVSFKKFIQDYDKS